MDDDKRKSTCEGQTKIRINAVELWKFSFLNFFFFYFTNVEFSNSLKSHGKLVVYLDGNGRFIMQVHSQFGTRKIVGWKPVVINILVKDGLLHRLKVYMSALKCGNCGKWI